MGSGARAVMFNLTCTNIELDWLPAVVTCLLAWLANAACLPACLSACLFVFLGTWAPAHTFLNEHSCSVVYMNDHTFGFLEYTRSRSILTAYLIHTSTGFSSIILKSSVGYKTEKSSLSLSLALSLSQYFSQYFSEVT
jgi:hypothetical protein